jgi:hypothetical protein
MLRQIHIDSTTWNKSQLYHCIDLYAPLIATVNLSNNPTVDDHTIVKLSSCLNLETLTIRGSGVFGISSAAPLISFLHMKAIEKKYGGRFSTLAVYGSSIFPYVTPNSSRISAQNSQETSADVTYNSYLVGLWSRVAFEVANYDDSDFQLDIGPCSAKWCNSKQIGGQCDHCLKYFCGKSPDCRQVFLCRVCRASTACEACAYPFSKRECTTSREWMCRYCESNSKTCKKSFQFKF